MLVDLHMHSFFSDGTMSPQELVFKAKEKNVGIMSITDHNRIEAFKEAKNKADELDIILIKGSEINVRYKDKILHLLAYSFDDDKELLSLIDKAHEELQKNSVDLVYKLSRENNKVSLEDFHNYEHDVKRGGWKGLYYLYDRGITNKLFEGFKYYSIYDCGYENYDFPSLEEVYKAIKKANGYAVLAHPSEYYKNLTVDEIITELEEMRTIGLDGIECYYPTHSEELTKATIDFCNKYDMLITTGSDEHGDFGKEAKVLEQTLGCLKIDESKLNIKALYL